MPARAKWCYKIGLARSGCSIFWKPKGATKDTEVREYPIKVQIEAVNKGEHHSITAQHPSSVGHGGTEGGGGTRDMTNWGVLEKTDITQEVGHMLGNPENYFTIAFNNTTVMWGTRRQKGKGIMNNPAEAPLAEHFWLVRKKFRI